MAIKKSIVIIAAMSVSIILLSLSGCQNQSLHQECISSTSSAVYSKLNTGDVLDTSQTGYSYTTNNGQFIITYDDNMIDVPLSTSDTSMDCSDFGVFISDPKIAVSYAKNDVITVLISNDKGDTWTSSLMDCDAEITNLFVGFTSEDTGWLIGCSFVGMGAENHFLYTTSDGGENWSLISSNIDKVYGRTLVGANFLNQEVGFLCFRYENADFMPPVLTTNDGGITWSKLSISIPDEYSSYCATALAPSYNGELCTLPVRLSKDGTDITTINFISNDLGKTFTLQS